MVEQAVAQFAAPVAQAEDRAQRFPCVGIALIYSARDDRGQPELGRLLHRAATRDMSLKGLSFDLNAPLQPGSTLAVLVGQPQTQACEQLHTTVRWCRPLPDGHFRVGVQIDQSQPVLRDLSAHDTRLLREDQVGLPVPSSVELVCPACGAHALFELVNNQVVTDQPGLMMPLYDCSVCETTRSIMGLLAYARQTTRPSAAATHAETEINFPVLPIHHQEVPTMTLKKILYAEDEPDIQAVAKLALEMVGGFEVLICGNGVEALKQVSGFAPDLILLDVMMPAMDGPTTLKNLRANPATASIPVIFLTAKVQPTEVTQYQTQGALDVIAKPFDPMTLAAQVRALWERHHG